MDGCAVVGCAAYKECRQPLSHHLLAFSTPLNAGVEPPRRCKRDTAAHFKSPVLSRLILALFPLFRLLIHHAFRFCVLACSNSVFRQNTSRSFLTFLPGPFSLRRNTTSTLPFALWSAHFLCTVPFEFGFFSLFCSLHYRASGFCVLA